VSEVAQLTATVQGPLVAGIVLIVISVVLILATVFGGVMMYMRLGRLYDRLDEKH
jgi:hypothetical protein